MRKGRVKKVKGVFEVVSRKQVCWQIMLDRGGRGYKFLFLCETFVFKRLWFLFFHVGGNLASGVAGTALRFYGFYVIFQDGVTSN